MNLKKSIECLNDILGKHLNEFESNRFLFKQGGNSINIYRLLQNDIYLYLKKLIEKNIDYHCLLFKMDIKKVILDILNSELNNLGENDVNFKEGKNLILHSKNLLKYIDKDLDKNQVLELFFYNGNYENFLGNNEKALEYYERSLKIMNFNHPRVEIALYNMAEIYI